MSDSEPGHRRGGLFGRILLTFIATALTSALVAAVAGYTIAERSSAEWIAGVIEQVEEQAPQFDAAVSDPEALAALATELGHTLEAQVGLYRRGGRKFAGQGPPWIPPSPRARHRKELRFGSPIIFRREGRHGPGVRYGIVDPQTNKVQVIVNVLPRPGLRLALPVLSVSLMLLVLGAGAWMLSRSLIRRLARIEASADRIAHGELHHRIALDHDVARDELDQLAHRFNEMTQKVESLIEGQRVLLANVSHELRTPVARIKVLVEILQERVEILRDRGDQSRPVTRLHTGLVDLSHDIAEIESLISDLLTSGRLELRHGSDQAIQATQFDGPALLERVARKFNAQTIIAHPFELEADELLMERLLSNLLANARRACPDGQLTIGADPDPTSVEITVDDEGPGVDPEHRESIFEPFTRLDSARDRDRGGVGLGLYLCRQICQSHGGSIQATDRPDGQRGARFVVRMPRKRPALPFGPKLASTAAAPRE